MQGEGIEPRINLNQKGFLKNVFLKKDEVIPLVDANGFFQGDLRGVIHQLSGGEFKEQERQAHVLFTEDAIERIAP